MSAFRIIRRLRDLLDFTLGVPSDGDVVTYDTGTGDFVLAAPAASGAPASADYLVGTAQGGLSAEIVVGAAPGGEFGGTWAAPTVDATHSGSSHAAVQAAAEATAAAALLAHESDPTAAHAGTAISNTPAGSIAATTAQAAINELDSEKAATVHAHAGEDITSGTIADARIPATIARDSEVTSAISAHEAATTAVHGIADTSLLALAAAHPILAPAASTRNVIQPTGAAIIPFVVKGFTAQSADLQQWQNSAATVLLQVTAAGVLSWPAGGKASIVAGELELAGGAVRLLDMSGNIFMRVLRANGWSDTTMSSFFQLSQGAAHFTGQAGAILTRVGFSTNGMKIFDSSYNTITAPAALLDVQLSTTTRVGLIVTAAASQTGDLQQLRDSSLAVMSRFNKAGYFMTRKVAAPADADMANSEVAIWLTDTPGATIVNFKAKDSGGTVRTATLAMA